MIPVVMGSHHMNIELHENGTLTARCDCSYSGCKSWIKVGAAGGRIVLLDQSKKPAAPERAQSLRELAKDLGLPEPDAQEPDAPEADA